VHVHLTDKLVCPRCGPPHGLVLLADRVADQRVHSGSLGCPNCRDRFPVEAGFADLRPPPRRPFGEPTGAPPEPDPGGTLELAALLGVTEGPAYVLLAGPAVDHATALAALVPALEVIALGPELRALPEVPGVSRMAAQSVLPLRDGALRGVGLAGHDAARWLEEAARVLAAGGRLVVRGGPVGVRDRAASVGLTVRLDTVDLVVAERAGPRAPSRGVRLPMV
jgi:uncharacterized protein YbaR (Trm112 family)